MRNSNSHWIQKPCYLSRLWNRKDRLLRLIKPDLTAKESELAASSTELSFKQLYTAVSALGEVSKDQCPACKTPLNQTYKDPFELATQELAKLAHLSQLEQERDELIINLTNAIKWVYQALKTCTERLGNDTEPNSLASFLVPQETQITLAWWQSLFNIGADGFNAWQHLHAQVQRLEQMDNGHWASTAATNRKTGPFKTFARA